MKKSYLLLATALGAVGAYLLYDETAGLGKVQRPAQGVARTPLSPNTLPARKSTEFSGEPARPPVERQESTPAPAPASRVPADDERELDDVGDWEYEAMEKSPQPRAATLKRLPGRAQPNRGRLGPEKKFEVDDAQ